MTDPLPPDLSLERIEELQAQCRNAFDLPQIRLSELSALLSLAHSAASGSEWRPIDDLPPDGDLIIAWGPHAKIKGGAYMIWEPSRLHAHRAGKHPSHLTYFATHFRNLPPAPTKKEPENG